MVPPDQFVLDEERLSVLHVLIEYQKFETERPRRFADLCIKHIPQHPEHFLSDDLAVAVFKKKYFVLRATTACSSVMRRELKASSVLCRSHAVLPRQNVSFRGTLFCRSIYLCSVFTIYLFYINM